MPQVNQQQLLQRQYRAIRTAALEFEGIQITERFNAGIRRAIAKNAKQHDLDRGWQVAEFKRLHKMASQLAQLQDLGPEERALAEAIKAAGLPRPESLRITEAPSLYRAKIDPGATTANRKAWNSDGVYAVACRFAKRFDRVSAKFAPVVSTDDDGDLLIDFAKRSDARAIAHFADYITPEWVATNKGRFLFVPGVAPNGELLIISRREPGSQSTLRGGMSGSGKSMLEYVDLHIQTLLLSPDELHLWLADPHAGLSPYEGLPHLHNRAIATEAVGIFANAVELVAEMNRRKPILKAAGVDNVDALRDRLPYCLGKFDELSGACDDMDMDLDAIAGRWPQYFRWKEKDGEAQLAQNNPKPSTVFIKLLSQIAKQGRKYGVHIDAIEQNPKADLLPTAVKSELVSIALKMKTSAGSRVIIDSIGAEKLLGKGDALLCLNGEMVRVQVLLADAQYDGDLRGECQGNRRKSAGNQPLTPYWGENDGNQSQYGFPDLEAQFPVLRDWLENPENGTVSELASWLASEVDRAGRSEATIALMERLAGTRSKQRYGEFAPIVGALLERGG